MRSAAKTCLATTSSNGISVAALQRKIIAGKRKLSLAASARTDDRGLYRIPSLTPGEYVVVDVAGEPVLIFHGGWGKISAAASTEYAIATWQPQIEGGKTGRELPAIVDQIVTMNWIDFGDRKPVRAFVCTNPNPWGYPAKDRSGRLEQLEPPDLGALIEKLTRPGERKPFITASPEPSAQT